MCAGKSLVRQCLLTKFLATNSLWQSDSHKVVLVFPNTGTGNGLLPDDIKPSPEPMLNNYQWGLGIIIWAKLDWTIFKISLLDIRKLSITWIQCFLCCTLVHITVNLPLPSFHHNANLNSILLWPDIKWNRTANTNLNYDWTYKRKWKRLLATAISEHSLIINSNFITFHVAWHASSMIQTTLDRLTAGCHSCRNQARIYNVILLTGLHRLIGDKYYRLWDMTV